MLDPIFLAAYTSDALEQFSRRDLLELLERARTNNARRGLSGLLLHAGGNFLQALEGPENVVREILARIERDPRHRNMQVLFFDHVPERLFADWSMGFEEARGLNEADHPGLSAFMQRDTRSPATDHGVMELLRSFRSISAH
ncbi:MAG: BLUF domain-containing protein [bacterium]